MDKLLYGAAYYDEYMPYDRLDKDIEMMKAAGMNVVRIAESTWSTCEPQPGVFDFSHVTRVIDAMEKAGMYVIVGTPTYAVPTWMEKMHPEIMAVQKGGRHIYGARQCMDITSPAYRFYAERVIRKLMEVTASRKCVIGFQLDNETHYYGSAGNGIQRLFVKYLREKFSDPDQERTEPGSRPGEEGLKEAAGSQAGRWDSGKAAGRLSDDEALERLNKAFGLDYWSNRINSWEDFPDVRGTINGSLAAEFDRFRRKVVAEFLSWQAQIVREYMRDDQFITHNFDYEWRDWSFGVQPDCDHFRTARALQKAVQGGGSGETDSWKADSGEADSAAVCRKMVAGCDIYHPTQEKLTGKEIAFGGDMNRSLLRRNYLVLETEAQGYPWWTPFPGQLRLQAYSHIASGADMVEYWHWHSIHNSFETYWKGVLSHDFEENDVYREAKQTGNELKRIGGKLLHLKKDNQAAILVSNEALSALDYFKIDGVSGDSGKVRYNDVIRWAYDALYEMNIECDFVTPDTEDLYAYRLLVVPALYSAPETLLERINNFAEQGGVVIETFKSGFSDDNVKVWTDVQPHTLGKGAGICYHEFAFPVDVKLKGALLPENGAEKETGSQEEAELFMELLEPSAPDTRVLLSYDHPAWGRYAAVTARRYGKGSVYYIGCMTSERLLKMICREAMKDAGIRIPELQWPLTVREGINRSGKKITFLFNYSMEEKEAAWEGGEGKLLLSSEGNGMTEGSGKSGEATPEKTVKSGELLKMEPWGVRIIEE